MIPRSGNYLVDLYEDQMNEEQKERIYQAEMDRYELMNCEEI